MESDTATYIGKYVERHSKLYTQAPVAEDNPLLSLFNQFKTQELSAEKEQQLRQAVKYLYKIARYLQTNTDMPLAAQYNDLIKKVKEGKDISNEVITLFEKTFPLENELKKAQDYFKENPKETFAGSSQGLMYSFVHDGKQIEPRNLGIGEGGAGNAKLSKLTGKVIKTQRIVEQMDLLDLSRESQITNDLGLADSNLIIREKNQVYSKSDEEQWSNQLDREAYKVYQVMENAGQSLDDYLGNHPDMKDSERQDIGISLLLAVDKLHTGKASKKNQSYAHRDIKPENLVIKDNKLRLIDFGLTRKPLNQRGAVTAGSLPYMPKDIHPNEEYTSYNERITTAYKKGLHPQSPNDFFTDRIATLRVIYHPVQGFSSIFPKASFDALPKAIRNLLDTQTMADCEKNAEPYPLSVIAAVLIHYKQSPERFATNAQEQIDKIAKTPGMAEAIIFAYQNPNKVTYEALKKNPVVLCAYYNLLSDTQKEDFIEGNDLACFTDLINHGGITDPEEIQAIAARKKATELIGLVRSLDPSKSEAIATLLTNYFDRFDKTEVKEGDYHYLVLKQAEYGNYELADVLSALEISSENSLEEQINVIRSKLEKSAITDKILCNVYLSKNDFRWQSVPSAMALTGITQEALQSMPSLFRFESVRTTEKSSDAISDALYASVFPKFEAIVTIYLAAEGKPFCQVKNSSDLRALIAKHPGLAEKAWNLAEQPALVVKKAIKDDYPAVLFPASVINAIDNFQVQKPAEPDQAILTAMDAAITAAQKEGATQTKQSYLALLRRVYAANPDDVTIRNFLKIAGSEPKKSFLFSNAFGDTPSVEAFYHAVGNERVAKVAFKGNLECFIKNAKTFKEVIKQEIETEPQTTPTYTRTNR